MTISSVTSRYVLYSGVVCFFTRIEVTKMNKKLWDFLAGVLLVKTTITNEIEVLAIPKELYHFVTILFLSIVICCYLLIKQLIDSPEFKYFIKKVSECLQRIHGKEKDEKKKRKSSKKRPKYNRR